MYCGFLKKFPRGQTEEKLNILLKIGIVLHSKKPLGFQILPM